MANLATVWGTSDIKTHTHTHTQTYLGLDEDEVRALLEAVFEGVEKFVACVLFGVFFASLSLTASGRIEGGRLEF